MDFNQIKTNLSKLGWGGLGGPVLTIMLLAMIVIPLPAFLLDLFFTFNIALSLIIVIVVIYTMKPLDFAAFPTVILVATLLRLALNVASTRIVLMEGHTGSDAAGKVIEAFGEFVIGGNFAVGLVVFSILIVINFIVITKGAGRVAEVSARFTLDAMPGKQMAIDADLNTGFLTQEEAKARREELAKESDFYGSMDGASKFVRGDAVAGIVILLINIIGGLSIGMLQHDMDFTGALERYVLLTIGDGLVAQIPGLLISVSAAIIVTKIKDAAQDVGTQIGQQLLDNPKPLLFTSGILFLLGIIPGMPNFVFLLLAAAAFMGATYLMQRKEEQERVVRETGPGAPGETETAEAPESTEPKELSWDDVQPVDIIGLEVGYRLIPMVDKAQGGQLMNRIKGIRRKLSQELGFLVQSVHIRDNLDLSPNAYRITLNGVPMGGAEIHPERDLAINPGRVFGEIQGITTKDPAFGLDAVWIETSQRENAQAQGYTVVDSGTVVATHLSEVIKNHAGELLGHEEVQELLDSLSNSYPKLVEDLVPKALSLSQVLKVLQSLLSEGIPIKDIRTIAETLADQAVHSQDPATLLASVRVALSRMIVQQLVGNIEEIPVIVLDANLEQLLQQSLQASGGEGFGFEPGLAERLQQALIETSKEQEMSGQESILLVAAGIRPWMSKFAAHSAQGIHVLSYNEIPDNRKIKVVATIGDAGAGI
ncbi:MAG: flagellar biosynthesis protein FlhA [Gammaproteobacteria bacterium]|nr:flagellar biosynthesis protein FlhA [Gammaproteobacteria bacterium]